LKKERAYTPQNSGRVSLKPLIILLILTHNFTFSASSLSELTNSLENFKILTSLNVDADLRRHRKKADTMSKSLAIVEKCLRRQCPNFRAFRGSKFDIISRFLSGFLRVTFESAPNISHFSVLTSQAIISGRFFYFFGRWFGIQFRFDERLDRPNGLNPEHWQHPKTTQS
jgi:hypothetical protein